MQKTAIGILAAAALLLTPALASPEGPVLRFDETSHDFGEVPSNAKQEYSWEFHNDGDAPLRIVETIVQCGCTATMTDNRNIPPGGTGVLKITFDPAGLNGTVRKSLAVLTNEAGGTRTLLEIRASVLPVETAVEEGAHPRTAGQSLLIGGCAGCHAAPAGGKTGPELYAAVCAMCHGPSGEGGLAPALGERQYLASRSDDELKGYISYGTSNPKMPGFAALMGGPLSEAQIDSLVGLIRSWARDPADGR